MKISTKLRVFLVILSVFAASARAETIAIPVRSQSSPANDLVFAGRVIDRDEAMTLMGRGVDISRLDPNPNDVWKPRDFPIEDSITPEYPADGAVVDFNSFMSFVGDRYRVRIEGTSQRGEKKYYQMMLGSDLHAALTVAAMLRRLGYPVQSPRHYHILTVRFPTESAMKLFADDLVRQTGYSEDSWIVAKDPVNKFLVIRDLALEPIQIDVPQLHWGIVPPARLKGRRAMRALLVPLALLDILENVNLYSWEVAQVQSRSILLSHRSAASFVEITYEDARWITRKIAAWKREDFERIIAAGKYPPDIAALITEKAISRRNYLVKVFDVHADQVPVNTELTIGAVVKGKATRKRYEGYAIQFMGGDPESPIVLEEVIKFLGVEAISYGLDKVTSLASENLTEWQVDDAAKVHQQDLKKDFIEHFQKNPGVPYERQVGAWGSPIGGVSFQLARHVGSGPHYGSDSELQLVDHFSYQFKLGYFMGIDGIPNISPGLTANLAFQRSYIHVRPIAKMDTALTADWTSVFVPSELNRLADVLRKGKKKEPAEEGSSEQGGAYDQEVISISEAEARAGNVDDHLKAFLDHMKEGELFTIVDSFIAGAGIQVGIPLAGLLGLDPTFSSNIGFSVNGQYLISARTMIRRTSKGIQVYLQRINQSALQVAFDFSFWIKILGYSRTWKAGNAHTEAFLMDELPSDAEERRKFTTALLSLVSRNHAEPLRKIHSPYLLKHRLNTDSEKFQFLWIRWHNVEEAHRVRIRPPVDREGRYDPKAHERVLFSHRFISLVGEDPFAFLSDVISGLAPGWGIAPNAAGNNPANTFLGSGHWNTYAAEAEVTPGKLAEPVAIIESNWGGWSIGKSNLFRIFNYLEQRMRPLNLNIPLIRREVFATVESLDRYRVTAMLVVYPEGIRRIKEAFYTPEGQPRDLKEGPRGIQAQVERPDLSDGNKSLARWENFQFLTYSNALGADLRCMDQHVLDIMKIKRKFQRREEARVKWTNEMMRKVLTHGGVPFHRVLEIAGADNYHFSVRVGGFRKGDENADTEYLSDLIGNFDETRGSGVFREFAANHDIMSYELQAQYLSEGY